PRSKRPKLGQHEQPQSYHQFVTNVPEYLGICNPRVLEDIKKFARGGGPDLSDLRNCPAPTSSPPVAMSSSKSTFLSGRRSSGTTITARTSSAYDRDFCQKLVDGGVYTAGYRDPITGEASKHPTNHKELREVLARPRESASPSTSEFEAYWQADVDARKEKQVSESIVPLIEGKIPDGRCRSGDILFNNLKPLTESNDLKSAKPDIYYGARPEQIHKSTRHDLGGYIVPSTESDLPVAPNFFFAVKGPDGSPAVAERQATYESALGARAMHKLQSYGKEKHSYDGKAHTLSATYCQGTLKLYTSHVEAPGQPGGPPSYHMTKLRSVAMDDSIESYKEGTRTYRNARDWCKKERDEMIREANQR
ncbi:hypothetical protein M011DRAFT_372136, partial [Sporormia fimetaria CBS 119925]